MHLIRFHLINSQGTPLGCVYTARVEVIPRKGEKIQSSDMDEPMAREFYEVVDVYHLIELSTFVVTHSSGIVVEIKRIGGDRDDEQLVQA